MCSAQTNTAQVDDNKEVSRGQQNAMDTQDTSESPKCFGFSFYLNDAVNEIADDWGSIMFKCPQLSVCYTYSVSLFGWVVEV